MLLAFTLSMAQYGTFLTCSSVLPAAVDDMIPPKIQFMEDTHVLSSQLAISKFCPRFLQKHAHSHSLLLLSQAKFSSTRIECLVKKLPTYHFCFMFNCSYGEVESSGGAQESGDVLS